MSRLEIGNKMRLVDGVVVVENLVRRKYMRVNLVGTEENLKEFFAIRCMSCVVRNIAPSLDNLGNGCQRATCIVDYEIEGARECIERFEEDDRLVVPDDNWFEASPEVIELLEKIAKGEVNKVSVGEEMKVRSKKDLGIVESDNVVILIGQGKRVINFFQNNCLRCAANGMADDTMPDVSGETYFVCLPVPKRRRICSQK